MCSEVVEVGFVQEVEPNETPIVVLDDDEEEILCDNNEENNESSSEVTVATEPVVDLQIIKTANVASILAGGQITYTLTYTNI
jgi:hypothetical protein